MRSENREAIEKLASRVANREPGYIGEGRHGWRSIVGEYGVLYGAAYWVASESPDVLMYMTWEAPHGSASRPSRYQQVWADAVEASR